MTARAWGHAGEDRLVEQFVAHPTVEALDEAVLHVGAKNRLINTDTCLLVPQHLPNLRG